jgi:hypothetical protein
VFAVKVACVFHALPKSQNSSQVQVASDAVKKTATLAVAQELVCDAIIFLVTSFQSVVSPDVGVVLSVPKAM